MNILIWIFLALAIIASLGFIYQMRKAQQAVVDVSQAQAKAEAELKAAQVEMENVPPAVAVRFDPRRLSRVFFNLVGNATDIMLNGGKIFLRFKLAENEIITEIEDSGPGIPPELAGKLFQPFATHGKTKGTGLGLSICKKIIEDHGGTIEAHSAAGRGAIFRFTLPLVK